MLFSSALGTWEIRFHLYHVTFLEDVTLILSTKNLDKLRISYTLGPIRVLRFKNKPKIQKSKETDTSREIQQMYTKMYFTWGTAIIDKNIYTVILKNYYMLNMDSRRTRNSWAYSLRGTPTFSSFPLKTPLGSHGEGL